MARTKSAARKRPAAARRRPIPAPRGAAPHAYDATRFYVGSTRSATGGAPITYVFDRHLPRYATIQVSPKVRYEVAFAPLPAPQRGASYTARRAGTDTLFAGRVEIAAGGLRGEYVQMRDARSSAVQEGVPALHGGSVALGELFDLFMRAHGVALPR